MSDDKKNYKMKYAFVPMMGNWSKKDLEAPPTEEELMDLMKHGWGGCDAVMLISVIYTEEGGASYAVLGLDGATGEEPTAHDQFKIWTLMANGLMGNKDLGPHYRDFAKATFESYMKMFMPHVWTERQKNIADRKELIARIRELDPAFEDINIENAPMAELQYLLDYIETDEEVVGMELEKYLEMRKEEDGKK